MTSQLTIDLDQAYAHVNALGGGPRIFFVAPEAPGVDPKAQPPRHLFGTLDEVLPDLNAVQRGGCAVFATVNAMRDRRRRKTEVTSVRAVWADRDAPGRRLPLPPSLRIRSSNGKGHDYLACDPADPLLPSEAERILRTIARDYGADPQACDLARVLRLAGSMHLKGEPQRVEIIGGTGETYSRAQLLAAFPEPEPPPRPVPIPAPAHWDGDQYVAAVICGVTHDLAAAVPGTRNASLNAAAFRLGQLGLSLDHATGILAPVALDIGLGAHEIAATVRSGVRAGAANPRGRAA